MWLIFRIHDYVLITEENTFLILNEYYLLMLKISIYSFTRVIKEALPQKKKKTLSVGKQSSLRHL